MWFRVREEGWWGKGIIGCAEDGKRKKITFHSGDPLLPRAVLLVIYWYITNDPETEWPKSTTRWLFLMVRWAAWGSSGSVFCSLAWGLLCGCGKIVAGARASMVVSFFYLLPWWDGKEVGMGEWGLSVSPCSPGAFPLCMAFPCGLSSTAWLLMW